MAESRKKEAPERRYEVVVSFDGLDLGDTFSAAPDAWALRHVETGYLRDVTEEVSDAGRSEVGQS